MGLCCVCAEEEDVIRSPPAALIPFGTPFREERTVQHYNIPSNEWLILESGQNWGRGRGLIIFRVRDSPHASPNHAFGVMLGVDSLNEN